MRGRTTGLVLAVAIVTAACGGDGGKGGGLPGPKVVDLRGKASGGQYPEVKVAAKDNLFRQQNIRIDVGVTVSWKNDGRNPHNVLPANRNQDFGKKFGAQVSDFTPGKSYEFKFDKPGTYRYFCSLHGSPSQGMIGAVVVGGGSTSSSGTIHVPKDFKTIQGAVDAAKPGALVLVAPGTYHEAVAVTGEHRNIVIRGEDRATTIVDGDFSEKPGHENGFKVLADGVAIENITARNFKSNSFFWTGVKGYRGSYLTSVRTGDYGIYAFDSVDGQFDHDYASGSTDAGFYIGQCFPCNAVITDVEAEWNGLGYSGTNSGGDLLIVNSSFHGNRAGIVPNSGSGEKNAPQHETTIVGNVVYSNNNGATSAIEIAQIATGNGILLAGGNDNVVERNLVYDHDIAGIAAIALPEKLIDPSNPNALNFDAKTNQIKDNVVRDSRQFDLGIVSTIDGDTVSGGNCTSGNTFNTSMPADIEKAAPCGGTGSIPFKTDLVRFASLLGADKPPSADYRTVELPDSPSSAKQSMPNVKVKPRPATHEPSKVDLASIEVPAGP